MKTRSYILCIAILVSLLLLALAGCGGGEKKAVEPVMAPGENTSPQVSLPWKQIGDTKLKVLSSNTFTTGSGEYVYLVGEAQNTGTELLGDVNLTATAYSNRGEAVFTRKAKALCGIVRPGAKIPYGTAMDTRDADRYELEIQGKPVQVEPKNKLEIANPAMTEPKAGYVWMSGDVKNVGQVAAKAVTVVAVLYDDKGAVVEAASEELKDPLAANATAPFKFIANHRGANSYELSVCATDAE